MEHDVHNLILDFWILDLVCLRIFVFWVLTIPCFEHKHWNFEFEWAAEAYAARGQRGEPA